MAVPGQARRCLLDRATEGGTADSHCLLRMAALSIAIAFHCA